MTHSQGYPPDLPAPATNTLALASLVSGVVALVLAGCTCGFGGLTGLVAFFLGATGRRRVRASEGREGGEGLALAGMITGVVAMVIGLLAVTFLVLAVFTGNADFTTDPRSPYDDYGF
ncbi:MAG: hypothetical protein AVDCRST_MAG72-2459 [uncultured Nocardioidaceae bacterium]|uniref:DUF4190 domain-containing protein n=1 Tax=uncultured Nocardioidaceae bacterium TaxID=253824 RepID=A0A6J4MPI2_9ACTN|nr:MAG: hypothetical protein AVDCRST_MAG72-2459 [uncultured Nocardioidaceae bacterium]